MADSSAKPQVSVAQELAEPDAQQHELPLHHPNQIPHESQESQTNLSKLGPVEQANERHGSSFEPSRVQSDEGSQLGEKEQDVAPNPNFTPEDKPYSIWTPKEKRIIVICAGICAFFSPISGQIYFPSLDQIAKDLNVSGSLVNLTITVYLIMQGFAPALVGGFSDHSGRRPTYIICFIIYAASNIGLGLQNNYAALMVLRCLQAAGGSGTVALANAVAADIVTSQERGVYISYMAVAPQAGPTLGPIIGGLLGQYLGWHSVFWFLLICTGVVVIFVSLALPETCRNVVDDGSVPPPKWSRCYLNVRAEKRLIAEGKEIRYDMRDELAKKSKFKFPNPLQTVKIIFTKEAGFALGYIGIVCLGYYSTITLIPSQFGSTYHFNQIQVALCYLPLGCGSLLASFVRGKMIDARFRYHAKRLDMPLVLDRRMDLSNFPIERARLEVAIPTLILGTAAQIGFGWMVQAKVNLSGPLIFLFIIGFCVSASLNTVSVLLVDIYPGRAGAATAANNMVRCWLGAGATSGVGPLINTVGIGWATTFFALLNVLFCPILFYIMKNGPKWRRATKERKEKQEAKKQVKADVGGEKGQAISTGEKMQSVVDKQS